MSASGKAYQFLADLAYGMGAVPGGRRSWWPWFCLALVWLAGTLDLRAQTFTATLDRNTVVLGESAALSLTFQGVKPTGDPLFPPTPGLAIHYTGPSQQVSWVNGNVTETLTLNYVVTPSQAGDFVVPPIRVQLGSQLASSQVLKLKVLPADAKPAGPQPAFVKLIVPKKELYLGEVMPIEIWFYCQNIRNPQMPNVAADGFLISTNLQPTQSRTQMGNQIYNLLVFKRSITAIKTGDLKLGPAECNFDLVVPITNRRQIDPFDFFGPRAEFRPTSAKSEISPIKVLPLPTENVPAGFNGAVGSFNMQTSAGPTNVAVGDPITIKIVISGQGGLAGVNPVPLNFGNDFKAYPPTTQLQMDPLGVEGVKTFEVVVIPQNAALKVLPPINFAFFDPAQKQYRTVTQGAIPITVRPGQDTPLPATPANLAGGDKNAQPPVVDIVNIKSYPGTLALLQPPVVMRPWFLGMQAIPVLFWIASLVWRAKQERLGRNPRLRRSQRVAKLVAKGLKELRQLAQSGQAEPFYASVFHLLQEQLGERLDLPASAITESVIEDQLRSAGIAESTLEPLQELFLLCNQARYAPVQSPQSLTELVSRVEAMLNQLQQLPMLSRRSGS